MSLELPVENEQDPAYRFRQTTQRSATGNLSSRSLEMNENAFLL
jgi:hypothetical protein